MAHSLTLAIAVCCVLSSIGVSLSQEPAKQDHQRETGNDGKNSSSVRAHMRQLQAFFDEKYDPVFFVATVTEVRPRKETDKLTGTLAGDENEVAVLRIHAVGVADHATLKEDKIIVCPVERKLRDRWLQWRDQKTEMLFQYDRFGKRESVQKFGC